MKIEGAKYGTRYRKTLETFNICNLLKIPWQQLLWKIFEPTIFVDHFIANLSKKCLQDRCVPVKLTKNLKHFFYRKSPGDSFFKCFISSGSHIFIFTLSGNVNNTENIAADFKGVCHSMKYVNFRLFPLKFHRMISFHGSFDNILPWMHEHLTKDSKFMKRVPMLLSKQ